jgi:hypothetical protein
MLKAFAAAALFMLAAPAAAQAPAAAPAPAPQTLTRAQGEEMVRGMFAQIDANSDGVIDAAEQKALADGLKGQGATDAMLAYVQKMFTDGTGRDGKVTLASFVAARMVAFDKADLNHDGKLDPSEQAASKANAEKTK